MHANRMTLFSALGLALALGILAAGCAYRTPNAHVPESIPPIAPDAITIDELGFRDDRHAARPEAEARVRRDAAAILARAAGRARPPGAATAPAPARVRLRVAVLWGRGIEDSIRSDGCAALGYAAAPLGAALDTERLSVEIALETRGRTWIGHGLGERPGSIYSPARRRALAEAIDVALAHAVPVDR